MTQLKNCPFCGQNVEVFENLKDNYSDEIEKCWTVIHECHVLGGSIFSDKPTELEAVAAWNQRATPTLPDEAYNEVIAALKAINEWWTARKDISSWPDDHMPDGTFNAMTYAIQRALAASVKGGSHGS